MKRGHGLLYGLIALMVAFWSGNFIVGKVALREFPAVLLSGLRVGLAALFMLPVYWWEGRKTKDRWTADEAPALVWLGLFGVALNQLFFVTGLSRTSVAHAAIIMGLTPLSVLLVAALVGLETLTVRKVAGMFVALGGVAILKAFEKAGQGPTWTGDLLTFGAGITFALFTVFGKRLSARHTPVTINAFAYVGGGLALAPVTLWQGWEFSFAGVSAGGWMALVYMALFPSVVAYLIFYYALTRIPASRVSAFTYFQPVVTTLLGVLLLHESVTASLVVGGAVIFSGVYLTERG